MFFFFFSSRRRHTRWNCDWSSDVCSSDLRISTALRACAVAKYCCNAWSERLCKRPKKSISQAADTPTEESCVTVALRVGEILAGVREDDESANPLICGNRAARWIRYCACVCATFSAATRKSRLFASPISTNRCNRGSVRKSRQPISTAGNVVLPGPPIDDL